MEAGCKHMAKTQLNLMLKVNICKLLNLLDRSITGFPPQFGQAPFGRADEQTHREVEGLFIYVAASLLRNHRLTSVCLQKHDGTTERGDVGRGSHSPSAAPLQLAVGDGNFLG